MHRARGVTLVEVVFGSLLLGVALAAVVSAVGQSGYSAARSRDDAIAAALISDLMHELAALPAFDGDSRRLGNMSANASRNARSCVADFASFTESPIEWGQGKDSVDGPQGWSRSVTVVHAELGANGQPSVTASETDVLLVTLSASREGRVVRRVMLARTAAGDAWHETTTAAAYGGE